MIKTADRGAAYLEATQLAGFGTAEARRFFGPPPALSPALERDYLTPWPAEHRGNAVSGAVRRARAATDAFDRRSRRSI